ncbi:hypothetical protein BDE02_08G033200 [Populus trichocarpa]|nr:hypothetical protein BDE02_08G033200 [Populus trichocarpa]
MANAVGLALAEAHLGARFNKPDCDIVDHRTYCIIKYPEEDAEFEVVHSGGLLPNWESCLSNWSVSDPVDATRG